MAGNKIEARGAEPGIGHNSKKAKKEADLDRLAKLVERIEHLLDERDTLNEDIKEVYTEAKNAEFNTKVLRKLIQLRRKPPKEEEEELLDHYKHRLGM